MSKIITYSSKSPPGIFCQIKLTNNERILISIANSGVKVFELDSMGLTPIRTIWECNDLVKAVKLFDEFITQDKKLLDVIKDILIGCTSIEEVSQKLTLREIK